MPHARLGEILIRMGAIDPLQLQSALAHQRQWGTPLGKTLVEKRFLTDDTLLRALSQQAGLSVIDLDQEYLDDKLSALLPRKAAEQLRVVPLRTEGKRNEILVVAIAAPATLSSVDAVQKASGKLRVRALLATDGAIERALSRIYEGKTPLPLRQRVAEAIPLQESEFELTPTRLPPQPAVLVYGWTDQAARTLTLILAADGIPAKTASAGDVLACRTEDVVLAPVASVEALFPSTRCPFQLVVLGRSPEEELERARRLGAKGFIEAPLDTALLLRAVRRCQDASRMPLIA